MRKVAYEVTKENGTQFITADYKEAKAEGNHIEKVILTEEDNITEEQKKEMFAHADKITEIIKKRKGV